MMYKAMGDLSSAIAVLQRSVDGGDPLNEVHLVPLMAERYEITALRKLARSGDRVAAKALVEALAEAKDIGGLRALAEQRKKPTPHGSVDLESAPFRAGQRLAALLVEENERDGAIEVLRAAVADGDVWARSKLAALLAASKDLAGLRELAQGGYADAGSKLARLLAAQDDSLAEIIALADDPATDSPNLRRVLARMLAERGDINRLRQRADAGDLSAARRLAEILQHKDDVSELSRRADSGDSAAVSALAEVLGRRGDIPELRMEALRGSQRARQALLAHLEHTIRRRLSRFVGSAWLPTDRYTRSATDDAQPVGLVRSRVPLGHGARLWRSAFAPGAVIVRTVETRAAGSAVGMQSAALGAVRG
jgi:hypothetical protein